MSPPDLLRRGKSSRKPVVAGEVFGFTFVDPDLTLVGRVVRDDARIVGFHDGIYLLLYVYREVFDGDPADDMVFARLTPDKLLMPPVLTDRGGWTRGAFRRLGKFPLTPRLELPRHVFVHSPGVFYDEYANRVYESQPVHGLAGAMGYNGLALRAFHALDLRTADGLDADDLERMDDRP